MLRLHQLAKNVNRRHYITAPVILIDPKIRQKEIFDDITDLTAKINDINTRIDEITQTQNTIYKSKIDQVKKEFVRIETEVRIMTEAEKHVYLENQLPNLLRECRYMSNQMSNIHATYDLHKNIEIIRNHSNALQNDVDIQEA